MKTSKKRAKSECQKFKGPNQNDFLKPMMKDYNLYVHESTTLLENTHEKVSFTFLHLKRQV